MRLSPKEKAIEDAKWLYAKDRIELEDLITRVEYLDSKPDDWKPPFSINIQDKIAFWNVVTFLEIIGIIILSIILIL